MRSLHSTTILTQSYKPLIEPRCNRVDLERDLVGVL